MNSATEGLVPEDVEDNLALLRRTCEAYGVPPVFDGIINDLEAALRRTPEPALAAFVEAARAYFDRSAVHHKNIKTDFWPVHERLALMEAVEEAYRRWKGAKGE